MNLCTLEEFHRDTALRRRLFESARRERARSLSAGLAWLRERLASVIRLQPSRWIARLG